MLQFQHFSNKTRYFDKPHIWVTSNRKDIQSYDWHRKYSLPFTKCLGQLACYVTAFICGPGKSEWNWKAVKANKTGKHSHLSSEKAKKQAVISVLYAPDKNAEKCMKLQKAGVVWTDDDFKYCMLVHYCCGSVVERIKDADLWVFRACEED